MRLRYLSLLPPTSPSRPTSFLLPSSHVLTYAPHIQLPYATPVDRSTPGGFESRGEVGAAAGVEAGGALGRADLQSRGAFRMGDLGNSDGAGRVADGVGSTASGDASRDEL